MAQEIFKVFGTIAIKEDGDIDQRLQDIDKSAGDTTDSFNGLLDSFDEASVGAGGLATILGTLLIASLKRSFDFANEFNDTLGNMQASTNATSKEMDGFEKNLEDIYLKGYGENIADIGDAIENVHKQTGLVNKELEKQTENTMMLSEKLGTDYGETIRTVDNMVKIFGMTHQEAFDLLAKGYQENLNVGGDLLDLFNEYSVKLKQVGFDENDMLNILIEGQKQGIFNYDVLLDGVKEFQIKMMEVLQDSEASKELFKDLGLNANEVKTAFSNGGEEAKNMSIKVIEALNGIKDPIEKNRIGTELFGTMWEDTGGKISDAMTGIQKDTVKTKGTMDKLLETKTDSFTEQWEKTKREMDIKTFKPLGKLLTGLASDILKFMNDSNKAIDDGLHDMGKTMDKWQASVLKNLDKWKKDALKVVDEWKKGFINYVQDTGEKIVNDIDSMTDDIVSIMNGIEGFVDGLVKGFNSLSKGITGVVNQISKISFPKPPDWFPGFENGVRNFEGGWAIVGEKGKELVHLPKGSDVYSNSESKQMMSSGTFGQIGENKSFVIQNLTIDAKNIKELNDLISIFKNIDNEALLY